MHIRSRCHAVRRDDRGSSRIGDRRQRPTGGKYSCEAALVLALLALIGQLAAPAIFRWHHRPRPGIQGILLTEKSDTNTARRPYDSLLYLPPEYGTPRDAWPLVVYLHGSGPRGTDLEKVKYDGLPALLETEFDLPSLVLSPQCERDGIWQPQRVMATIDEACRRYKIDAGRVYLTGCSMGGYAAWSTAAAFPDRFLAIAPICGRSNIALASKLKGLSVWAFHGAKDTVIPLDESTTMVDAVRQAGGTAELTVYQEAGHDIGHRPFLEQRVIEWMLEVGQTSPDARDRLFDR